MALFGTMYSFGNCEQQSFQWQSPPPVLASLYLNNNKTYIIPGGSGVKKSACSAGDAGDAGDIGSIPG